VQAIGCIFEGLKQWPTELLLLLKAAMAALNLLAPVTLHTSHKETQ
jgi:hypothetical protein